MAATRIIKDDALLRKDRYKRADDARQVLNHEIQSLGSSVDMELRERIINIHGNAAALNTQSKTLQNRTNQLAKTTKQWGGMADSAMGKLKEFGDLQNWAEMLERDLLIIEDTLRIVHDEDDTDSISDEESQQLRL